MRNIFESSQEWIVRRYWVETLNISANFAGIGAVAYAFWQMNNKSLVSLYVLALLTTLFIVLIIQEFRFARKAAYAESLRYVHAGLHYLRDTAAELEAELTDEQLARHLQQLLASVAAGFSLVTRTSCRACIKVLVLDSKTPQGINPKESMRFLLFRTFARDPASGESSEAAYWLTEDTALSGLLLDQDQAWFVSNDLKSLASRGHYKSPEIRSDKWPSEYRSLAIWPIRKMVKRDGGSEPEFRGFLCVDSGARSVFEARYDFHMGAAVADALYMYLATAQNFLTIPGQAVSIPTKVRSIPAKVPSSPPKTLDS
ncbi:MAG: hypothetical protein ACLPSW_11575 [Roseiarcus sp.]